MQRRRKRRVLGKSRTRLTPENVYHIFQEHFKLGRGRFEYDSYCCPRPPCPLCKLPRRVTADEIRHLLEYHFLKLRTGGSDHTPFDSTCPRPPCPLP